MPDRSPPPAAFSISFTYVRDRWNPGFRARVHGSSNAVQLGEIGVPIAAHGAQQLHTLIVGRDDGGGRIEVFPLAAVWL